MLPVSVGTLGMFKKRCPHLIWGFFTSQALLLISTGQPPPHH
jgi:hypothetical protein